MAEAGGWFLIYTANFAHCFICRGFMLSRVLACLAGFASWISLNPQLTIIAEFDRKPECDPVTTAKFFHRHGYAALRALNPEHVKVQEASDG